MKLAIYNLLVLLLIPVFLVRILLKSFSDVDYRINLLNRFGYKLGAPVRKKRKIIWFHAVSLGEVIGSQNIIHLLLKEFDVVLTTTTPTGFRQAKELFNQEIMINYVPWDFHPFIKRFIDFYKPDALLIFETEIWPSMISLSSARKIPIYLLNGRLSEKSFNAYEWVSWLFKETIEKITYSFVQTANHKKRFIELGMSEQKIKIAGSVKFDLINLETVSSPDPLKLPYILAASTHYGEDEIMLNAYQKIKENNQVKLFICPRHPDRSLQIYKLATQMNLNVKLFSELSDNNYDVCIVDSIGLLTNLYANAEVAFVGGSLVKRGGHNLIEPAALETPILIGPYTYNFEEIVEKFVNSDACIVVNNQEQLFLSIQLLLTDKEASKNLSKNALKVVEMNKGSTHIQVSYIMEQLGERN